MIRIFLTGSLPNKYADVALTLDQIGSAICEIHIHILYHDFLWKAITTHLFSLFQSEAYLLNLGKFHRHAGIPSDYFGVMGTIFCHAVKPYLEEKDSWNEATEDVWMELFGHIARVMTHGHKYYHELKWKKKKPKDTCLASSTSRIFRITVVEEMRASRSASKVPPPHFQKIKESFEKRGGKRNSKLEKYLSENADPKTVNIDSKVQRGQEFWESSSSVSQTKVGSSDGQLCESKHHFIFLLLTLQQCLPRSILCDWKEEKKKNI